MTTEPTDSIASTGLAPDDLVITSIPAPRETAQPSVEPPPVELPPYGTVRIGRATLALLDPDQVGLRIHRLAHQPWASLVVTANADHIVQLEADDELAAAYAGADLAVIDGQPLAWTSRLMGHPTPRIAGVDLFIQLCERAGADMRLFLLGGSEPNSQLAERVLAARYPNLLVVGRNSDWIDVDSGRRAMADIQASGANVIAVFYGCPKQEKWVHRNRDALPPGVYLCLGGTIDIVSGSVPRAGQRWQRLGLEWLYRLRLEPGRLWRRYLVDDPKYVVIAARSIWRNRH